MNWLSILLGNLNYTTVFFLMMLESTVIPVPSELVVSPAAYHAAGGHLNIFLVILFATLGADPHKLSYFWILPPLMGIVVQPIVGTLSDKTWTRSHHLSIC